MTMEPMNPFPFMTNGYLIDMDGVIFKGSKLLPGAVEFIEQLKRLNAPFLFLTNNSERTPKDLVSKLGHSGLKVSWKNFYTAAHCTADFLTRQKPICSAFVIGEGGLLIALQEAGIAFDSIKPDFVVVGEGRSVNFELMEKAVRLIVNGSCLVATNPDTWCPTDSGPRPGTGALAALLESATNKRAYYLGKPNPFMFLTARHRLGLRTQQTIMIGDTMETDIRGAIEIGIQAYLVLTGSTRREELINYAYQPTRVLESVQELAAELKNNPEAQSEFAAAA
ncbi:MAG TPA: HAD-IIA family hydrolase [Candidatus Eisenbacteria bacterium]|jgi:NagD protein|nr:HAD-IIA family hydrolase [Candidatus Eisenbacteria bacterium]